MNFSRIDASVYTFNSTIATIALGFIIPMLAFTALPLQLLAMQQQNEQIYIEGEFEQTKEKHNWETKEYYTGVSLYNEGGEPDSNGVAIAWDIPRKDDYYLWTLNALKDPLKSNETSVLKAQSAQTSTTLELDIKHPSRALLWQRFAQPISITNPRIHQLKLSVDSDVGVYLDRWIVTTDPDFRPNGYNHFNDTTEIRIPPAWTFGVLYGGYTNQAESIARVKSLTDNGYPVDAYWIDSWFWDYTRQGDGPGGYVDFVSDTAAYPNPEEMWSFFEHNNIKGGIWIWNTILKKGNEEVFNHFLKEGHFASVYMNRDGWHNEGSESLTGDIDFTDKEAVAYWKAQLKPFFEAGLDFLKLDRSSAIPFTKAAFEATQQLGHETEGRGFVLAHVHSTYDPRFKKYPTKWSGDAKIAWNQPDYPNMYNYSMGAYKENVQMVADPRRSTYEIPFLTHDLGGYNFFGSIQQSDSLYMRWTQFSMMNPITTIFSTADNPTSNLPLNFSQQAQQNFKKYAGLKLRLFPYIYTYAHKTRETGRKMIQGRYDWPDTQYLLGEEFLVAPIVTRGKTSREVLLPAGNWYYYHSDKPHEGNQTVTVDAPLDELPLFVKAGAIIPMRRPAANIVSGNNDTLDIHYYPGSGAGGKESSFTLYEEDGTSEAYRHGAVARTEFQAKIKSDKKLTLNILPTEGQYADMPEHRVYSFHIHATGQPDKVTFNGTRYKSQSSSPSHQQPGNWNYNSDTQLLIISVPKVSNSERHALKVTY